MTEPKNDPPNLDLIGMVQQARMQHDADVLPSQVNAVYWIESKPEQTTQQPTVRAGAFVLQTDIGGVDALWLKIRAATRAGKLGYKSKVSTASPSSDPNARIVRVLTYDSADSADIERIRAALDEIGLKEVIVYEVEKES
ncbi:MAG: DUF1917 domain-containing protein [Chitinophagaceae bacterium]|nr:DUF1917 domain-containing protein [Anaerolineae bacterium]